MLNYLTNNTFEDQVVDCAIKLLNELVGRMKSFMSKLDTIERKQSEGLTVLELYWYKLIVDNNIYGHTLVECDTVNLNQVVDLVNQLNGEVYIWGAYEGGAQVYRLLVEHGLEECIRGFCDGSAEKQGKLFMGKMTYSYDNCVKNKNTIFVITLVKAAKLVYDKVKEDGVARPVIFNLNYPYLLF